MGQPRPRAVGSPLAAIEVRTGSHTGPILTTANLVSTGSTAAGMVWSSQTFPISMTGKHELFFVFRSVTGGATGGNLFNLNWAEFGGNGVTVVKTEADRARWWDRAGDAVALARHARLVRRVHAGRLADLRVDDDGQRDLERG